MPRKNYRDRATRRKYVGVFDEPEQSEHEILMTNGSKVTRITVAATGGVPAWNKAIRLGLKGTHPDMPGLWWPIEITRGDWKYAAV